MTLFFRQCIVKQGSKAAIARARAQRKDKRMLMMRKALFALMVLLTASLLFPAAASPATEGLPWTPAAQRDKIVIISDIHLGIEGSHSQNVHNKPLLVDFLWKLQKAGDVRELVIAGDFLDEWYLPMDYPPYADSSAFYRQLIAGNHDVFDELKNVMASGIRLVYVVGNHDMTLESSVLDEALPGIVQPRDADGLGVWYTGDCREIAVEHGHRYDVFCAPDTLTNRALCADGLTSLPPGYFFARAAASWVIQGKPAVEKSYPAVTAIPSAITDPDQFSAYLYYQVLSAVFSRVTPKEAFEEKALALGIDGYSGFFSVADMFPSMQPDGSITAPVLYRNFQRTWAQRQQVNRVRVQNTFALAVAGNLSSDYFFSQAKAQYLDDPDENIDVTVFGHTHVPGIRQTEGGKRYVNTGAWADADTAFPSLSRTFALITAGKTFSSAALYAYMEDGTMQDVTDSAGK